MKKAKAKAKAKTKKANKRTGSRAAKKSIAKTKHVNPTEVRQDITDIVGGQAKRIARKVLNEAVIKGQLATVKFLFEVAGVYPPIPVDENATKPEEDTLARRLIQRLGLPEGPLPSCEDDDLADDIELPVGKSVSSEETKISDKAAVVEVIGEVAAD